MVRRMFTVLAGLALVAAPLSLAAPAVAATPHAIHPGSHATVRPGGVMVRVHGTRPAVIRNGVTVSASSNWSGYAAVGTYTSVSANWTEPTGTCSSNSRRTDEYSAFWVGLDGFSTDTVEQTGSEVDCDGTTPSYYAWWEMYPGPSENFRNTVKPGDQFYGSVTYDGTVSSSGRHHGTEEEYTLVLQDITQNWKQTLTEDISGAENASAEAITEAPCCTNSGGILPLADFNTVSYSNVTANGQPIGDASNLQEMYIADSAGNSEDSTTALTGGNAFSNTWLRSS